LCGCAAPLSALATAAQAHLAQQADDLAGAMTDLDQARQRLASQADAHQAAAKVESSYGLVRQAAEQNQAIAQDFRQLNATAQALQHQIDAHRNDLLGPRGKRIRNTVIILAVLIAIGAALLQLGPIFGGPVGGAIVVAGHLLTAFIVPLMQGLWWLVEQAWSAATLGADWVVAELEKLGNAKTNTVTNQVSGANSSNVTPASH
jgi:preprotein translocase subunit SecF